MLLPFQGAETLLCGNPRVSLRLPWAMCSIGLSARPCYKPIKLNKLIKLIKLTKLIKLNKLIKLKNKLPLCAIHHHCVTPPFA